MIKLSVFRLSFFISLYFRSFKNIAEDTATFEIMTNNKRLTVGGVLVALAALLHAAPVFCRDWV